MCFVEQTSRVFSHTLTAPHLHLRSTMSQPSRTPNRHGTSSLSPQASRTSLNNHSPVSPSPHSRRNTSCNPSNLSNVFDYPQGTLGRSQGFDTGQLSGGRATPFQQQQYPYPPTQQYHQHHQRQQQQPPQQHQQHPPNMLHDQFNNSGGFGGPPLVSSNVGCRSGQRRPGREHWRLDQR